MNVRQRIKDVAEARGWTAPRVSETQRRFGTQEYAAYLFVREQQGVLCEGVGGSESEAMRALLDRFLKSKRRPRPKELHEEGADAVRTRLG